MAAKPRSEIMSNISGAKGMNREMAVGQFVHPIGFTQKSPGKTDRVIPTRRTVILVHGCFWHQQDAPTCRMPVAQS